MKRCTRVILALLFVALSSCAISCSKRPTGAAGVGGGSGGEDETARKQLVVEQKQTSKLDAPGNDEDLSGSVVPSQDDAATRSPAGTVSESRTTPGLEALLRQVRRKKVTYRAPSVAERGAYRQWVERVTRALDEGKAADLETIEGSAPAGFKLSRLTTQGDDAVWVIHEEPGAERGAGVLALRVGQASPMIVEAPHTFFDMHTLDIALSTFDVLGARALLINTIHRGGEPGASKSSEDVPSSDADVAHNASSFFSAAHEGVSVGARSLALQIHGFRDSQAPGVEAIVSAAGTFARLDRLLASLRAVLPPDAVRHYPSQIRQLGGTTNVQARWSAAQGHPFIHLELSHSLRSRLKKDESLRRRFAKSMGDALESGWP